MFQCFLSRILWVVLCSLVLNGLAVSVFFDPKLKHRPDMPISGNSESASQEGPVCDDYDSDQDDAIFYKAPTGNLGFFRSVVRVSIEDHIHYPERYDLPELEPPSLA